MSEDTIKGKISKVKKEIEGNFDLVKNLSIKAKEDLVKAKGRALELAGQAGAQDEVGDWAVTTRQKNGKDGSETKYVGKHYTNDESNKRMNKRADELDLAARKKLVDAGGDVTPNIETKAKLLAGDIGSHITKNLPAYGGAAVAGLGAYGLYKYLKNKKKKEEK